MLFFLQSIWEAAIPSVWLSYVAHSIVTSGNTQDSLHHSTNTDPSVSLGVRKWQLCSLHPMNAGNVRQALRKLRLPAHSHTASRLVVTDRNVSICPHSLWTSHHHIIVPVTLDWGSKKKKKKLEQHGLAGRNALLKDVRLRPRGWEWLATVLPCLDGDKGSLWALQAFPRRQVKQDSLFTWPPTLQELPGLEDTRWTGRHWHGLTLCHQYWYPGAWEMMCHNVLDSLAEGFWTEKPAWFSDFLTFH